MYNETEIKPVTLKQKTDKCQKIKNKNNLPEKNENQITDYTSHHSVYRNEAVS